MGTAFLTVLGLAITASQFSCTKGSAQTTNPTVVGKVLLESSTGGVRVLYTVGEDLKNPIQLPASVIRARFSADYNSLFTTESNTVTGGYQVIKYNFLNGAWVKDAATTPLQGYETTY